MAREEKYVHTSEISAAPRRCWRSRCSPRRSARAQTSQQVTVDGARKVLADLRHDKAFGNAVQLMRQAKAVFIVPKLVKGGFIVGGEGGDGVMMVQRRGGWSAPAFYAIGAALLRPAGRAGAVRD